MANMHNYSGFSPSITTEEERQNTADRVTMDQLNLSSEEKLLLYCSRLSISDDLKHKIDEIFSNELDWNFILECSARHGVSPLFYRNLKNINHSKDVPPEIMKELEKRYYGNLARNMLLYDELGKVLKAFKREGIETIVLKGAFLAEEIYKNIALRTMSDIDLLIKKEDLQRAKFELEKLMYSPTVIFPTKLHEHYEILLSNELPPFVHETKKIVIEIHFDIQPCRDTYKVDIDELWKNVKSTRIAGIEVFTFAPENLLQHLCLHMYKHITLSGTSPAKPLRDYCDIAEVTRQYKNTINWNSLLQNSKKFGVEEPIFQGLTIAKEYFDAFVPESVIHELKPVKPNVNFEDIFKGVVKENQSSTVSYLNYLKNVRGTLNKLHIIFGEIFPSKNYIIWRYSLTNEKQVYRYYLIHSGINLQSGLFILKQFPHYIFKSAFWRK